MTTGDPKPTRQKNSAYTVAVTIAVVLGLAVLLHDPTGLRNSLARGVRSIAPSAFATDNTATAGNVNVCIFLIDTLRADRLTVYGYDRRPTSPNMEALARDGVVFEQAYSAAPWTLPSVASLVTSQMPCEHGLVETRRAFAKSVETLPEHLKAIGFTTIGIYANTMVSPDFGFGEGYDFYCESRFNAGPQVAQARQLYAGQPFFLYVHNYEPHNPEFFAPPHTPGFRDVSQSVRDQMTRHYGEYRASVWGDYEAGRPAGTTDVRDLQARHVQAFADRLDGYSELYDAAVHMADERLGSAIDTLKQRGEWDNTLFILLADHGEEMHDHGGWSHDQSVYEELIHVPLIVKFPHNKYAGKRVRDVVSLLDVMPTVLDAIGQANRPTNARGRSLLPLIEGRARRPAGAMVIPSMRCNVMSTYPYWRERIGDLNIVVRQDDWKAIWNVDKSSVELYDLATDPHEQRDLSAEQPDRAQAMRDAAEQWYAEFGDRSLASQNAQPNELDDKTIQGLRTLGYVK